MSEETPLKKEIDELIKEAGELLVREESLQITNQLAKIVEIHPDLQCFFSDRFFLRIKQAKLTLDGNLSTLYTFKRKFRLSYNSPSLINRIKFFILDISTWLKEKIKNE